MRHRLAPEKAMHDFLSGRAAAVLEWLMQNTDEQSAVVNVGCGFGWLEEHALRRGFGSNIISLEVTAEDLVTFNSRIQSDQVSALVASALALPFQDESVDVYLAIEVLEHLPPGTERVFFAELSRVLRPGGVALITTPAAGFRSQLFDPAWIPLKHRHYPPQRVQYWALGSELEVSRLLTLGGWAEALAVADLYVSKWIFRRPPLLARILAPRQAVEWSREFSGFMGLWVELRKPVTPNEMH